MNRPCLDCGTPSPNTRCRSCTPSRSRSERGYGTAHQQARRQLAATLPAQCGYGCPRIVTADTFVAAHVVDGDPNAGWIAACRSCNERAKRRG